MKIFMKTILISSIVSMVTLSPVLADDSTMSYQQSMMSGSGPGYGMGYGRGMGPGYGMGYGHGMGPGYGMGYGHGMGPGYGMGYGHGMRPGYGMRPGRGMGPGYGMSMLDLNDAQIKQLEQIQTENMKTQRSLMRQLWQEQEKMEDLLNADKRDPAAIGKAYGKISELQQQALEGRINMENKMQSLLSEEQKKQMNSRFHRGMMGY